MPRNEVRTDFVADAKQLFSTADAVEKRLQAINASFAALGANPTFGNAPAAPIFKAPDAELRRAQADIARYGQERLAREKAVQLEIERGEKALTRIKIFESKTANDAAIREIRERERAERQARSASGNGGGNDFRDVTSSLGFSSLTGLGAAGAIGAAVYGIKEFVDITGLAIEKSVASSRATRILASSATEAGKAYGELSDANKKYAETLGLSEVATARTTAKIQQLATFSGKPRDADKLSAGFADLSAAKGIDSKDLEQLIGTILSGQDEGLNRLGIGDPGQLYKTYADSIGVASDKLTQHQKVQAAVNAVMDKSLIFKGTAAARMNSLEGQTARVSAQFDNFTTALSNSFTQSYTFNAILTETIRLTKSLTYDTDELNKKRSQGTLTQKDITEAAKPSFLSEQALTVKRGAGRAEIVTFSVVNELLKYGSFGTYHPFDQPIKDVASDLGSTDPKLQQQLREDYLRQQINAQILLDAKQKQSADEQKQALDEIIAKEEKRQQLIEKQADFLNSFKDPRSTTSDIESKLQNLKNGSVFGEGELTEAETKKLIQAGEQEISQRTAQTYQRVLQSEKGNLNELRRELANIANDPKLFFEQRENLTASFERKIKETTDRVVKLAADYRENFISLKADDNPFVKYFSDIETATDRAREKYKDFTDLFGSTALADKIAEIEKAKTQKEANLKDFDNRSDALKLRQDASRLAATPETQFADFKRALDRIGLQSSNLTANAGLQRQIEALSGRSVESDIARSNIQREDRRYRENFKDSQDALKSQLRDSSLAGLQNFETVGSRYNAQNDLRRLLKDSSSAGLEKFLRSRQDSIESQQDRFFKQQQDKEKISDALSQLQDLKGLSLEGTGGYGESLIAKEIAGVLNSVKDVRTDRASAQTIRTELTKANRQLIEGNNRNLADKLEEQRFQQLGKKFAREQIGFINSDLNLTKDEKARRRLAVTDSLGDDLDPRLKFEAVQNKLAVALQKESQLKEGNQILRDSRTLLGGIFKAVSGGIKLDPATLGALNRAAQIQTEQQSTQPPPQAVQITVKDETNGGASIGLQKSPSAANTARHYDDVFNDPNYRTGDEHLAGDLYGSRLR